MTERKLDRRAHLFPRGTALAEPFTSPSSGGKKFRTKPADRASHGAALRKQLEVARVELERRRAVQLPDGIDVPRGFYLEFESPEGYELKLDSLESLPKGVELMGTRFDGQRNFAVAFVPHVSVDFFLDRVEQYITQLHPKYGKPKNLKLIESIAKIRLAVAESFWTDPWDLLPPRTKAIWWEVWLRGEPATVLPRVFAIARAAGLEVGKEHQAFPDRTVIRAYGTLDHFARALGMLDVLAELRRLNEVGGFFDGLRPVEQAHWAADLLQRMTPASADAVSVAILDSGVNRAHPLLDSALTADDVHACRPEWGAHDHHGHGTEMAGIALYGDLADALASPTPLVLRHRLESAKILPPKGSNPAELYGWVTSQGVSRVEIQAPKRLRVFSLAVTTREGLDHGSPTSWSAEVDKLAAGVEDGQRRLFFVSAGNLADAGKDYPSLNLTSSIQDPAHAWNVLTVGAWTDRTRIDDPTFAGWSSVAPRGGLAPCSTTSCLWDNQWPIKPDIVMEGGNMAVAPGGKQVTALESLSVLTTHHELNKRSFTSSTGTSAATAAAARFAAIIRSEYPLAWPETVRALMVDAAEWPEVMKREVDAAKDTKQLAFTLRSYGFGVPDLERALWSASNSLALVVEDSIQPFEGKHSNEMKLHKLPWPRKELEQLGHVQVELRVTLSYFVEPNPARRGWKKRHRYASHGLRFAVQKPSEHPDTLRRRVNKEARAEDDDESLPGDADGWLLKPTLRSRGSLHHDRWQGTAAELATREHIAIFPVIGWWRERVALERSKSPARYALVVSIRTPPTAIDIYQPVATQIAVPIGTSIPT